ncbi:Flp pilus assembly complex ATPase component TadA [bacterium]|nr:Flp pilus assembly complex ATPase component TadA [bacterium]
MGADASNMDTQLATTRPLRKVRDRFGEILLAQGIINENQLEEAVKLQKTKRKKLGVLLIELGYCGAEQVQRALAIQLGVDFVDVRGLEFTDEQLSLISSKFITSYKVLPYRRQNNRLYVVMSDPLDYSVIQSLELATDAIIQPLIGVEEDIKKVIYEHFGAKQTAEQLIADLGDDEDAVKEEEEADVNDAPVVRLVNSVLENAIREKASDIHIEPEEKQTCVRLRIDGRLHRAMTIPKQIQSAVISRLKIMGRMDIAEKRIPQDGKIKTRLDNRPIDIRVNTLPTVWGEKLVMRILDQSAALVPLEKLGFREDEKEVISKLIKAPNGIILVCGPTGSGKSTTLYSILSKVATSEINVTTVEDPVEYQMPGINQVNTNPKAGMTFASVLKSLMRQDPDVIMVGEIRDKETAEIAVQASLTGHLVISTIHTNDAPSTVSRLFHMGLEPFAVSAALIGVIAQRLLRRICEDCKEAVDITEEQMKLLKPYFGKETPTQIFKGKGCKICHNTGYKGRVGIYEIMMITPELREQIINRANTDKLRESAIKQGMKQLYDSGMLKVIDGITTIEEVFRTARSDA